MAQTFMRAVRKTLWDDYGCIADDPTFDNGPILTQLLSDMGESVTILPVGRMADYYVSTPIVWGGAGDKHGGALMGCGGYTYALTYKTMGITRLVWNGSDDLSEPVIDYRGVGGRIQQLAIHGGSLIYPYDAKAGYGIKMVSSTTPPTGNLTTDQLAILSCDIGIAAIDPDDPGIGNHADHICQYSPLFHHVRIPLHVDCDQSVIHNIYDMDIRSGWEIALNFLRGGKLNVFGMYVGYSDTKVILSVGKSTCNNDDFTIHGLEVDGSVVDATILEYGQYLGRVRIDGHVGCGATLLDPFVREREGGTPNTNANIIIDMDNAEYILQP